MAHESGGNACALSSLNEVGPWQLMPPHDIAQAGTTVAALRTACGSGGTTARALTDTEVREHVVSFSRFLSWAIQLARTKLAAVGASWDESSPDFWRMVKFQHTAPGVVPKWLAAAKAGLGRAPRSWAEIVPYAAAVGIPANWVNNATSVGGYGKAVAISTLIALAGGAALLYYLYTRKRRR